MKKIILMLLTLVLCLSVAMPAFATPINKDSSSTQGNTLFISRNTPQEVVDYALKTLPEIAYPIGDSGIFSLSELSDVSLGSPINYYDLEDESLVTTNKYIFPVLLDGEIRASLEILDASEGMSAALHASGITQGLSSLIDSNRAEQFLLVVDDSGVYAANQTESILLFDSQTTDSSDEARVESDIEKAISSFASTENAEPIQHNNAKRDGKQSTILVAPTESIGVVEIVAPIDVAAAAYPTSGAVTMSPVYQSGENCGSAAIAAIVNKIKGTSLTANGVNTAASGSSSVTASIDQLFSYVKNTHSLNPTKYYGGPSLSTVQSQIIDRSRPMFNVFSTPTVQAAHAMALNGYAQQPGGLYYQHVTTWTGYATYLVVTANSTFAYGGHTFSPYAYGSGF